ncbi:MAG: insulinase family protein [Spirochaetaceae bacterium]|jgi:zinc protease|nr:insulinase family protein [Spirochaetaceae bacterium]
MKKLLLTSFILIISVHIAPLANADSPAFAWEGINLDEKLPFMPDAKTGKLENGLTYYVLKNESPRNRAFIRLVVNAGSVLEEEDERGLAHFVEHMAFNGTSRFPEQALIDYMRSLGMRFGADLNAFTSFDETVYILETPTVKGKDGKKTIPVKALEIFDDWTHTVLFNEKDVDEERAIILEEKRTRSGVQERLFEAVYPFIFEGSRYAARLPIGIVEVISGAPASKLKGFYEKWYKPENMAIIIVGDFDADALAESLPSIFTAEKNEKPFTRPVYNLPPPENKAPRIKVWKDGELSNTFINIYYKMNYEPNEGDMRTSLRRLVDGLADSIITERFETRALEPDAPFTSGGMGISRLSNTAQSFVLAASPKDGRETETINALLAEKERLLRYGFTRNELERAKKSFASIYERYYNERGKQPSSNYLREFTEHFLNNVEAPGIEWEYQALKTYMPLITVEALNERLQEYFAWEDVTAFVAGNTAAALPADAEIAALIENAPLMAVLPPDDAEFDDGFLDQTPAKGSIVKEIADKPSGSKILTLSNGAKVALRPTDNKDDDITLYALAKGGTGNVPKDDIITARLAQDIAAGSGIGKWKTQELSKKLSGKQVSIGFSPTTFTRNFSGNSNMASLRTLFELIYLNFTEPRLDMDALKIVQEAWETGLKTRDDNPENVFQDEITKFIYGESPYFNPLRIEDLSKIDIQKARNFIAAALNPPDWTFVFTGNIDEAVLKPLIETYIASIPVQKDSAYSMKDYPELDIARPENESREIRKGKDNRSLVFISRFMPEAFVLKQALAANVLSEYLDIILTNEIREKKGGVYSIYADVSLSALPPRKNPKGAAKAAAPLGELSLEVFFICDPARVDELSAAVNAVLDGIAAGIIDNDTFTKARFALIQNLEESLQSNLYIARSMCNYAVVFQMPMGTVFRRDKEYQKIKEKDVQAVMRRILGAGEVKAVLVPESGG